MAGQTNTHTFIPQQEHHGICTTIDSLYIASVLTAAELRRWLIFRQGPIRDPFLSFYENFIALFTMTHKHKEMEPYRAVADKVSKWGFPSNHIDPDRCMTGIKLFDEWQTGLFNVGLLSVRK